MKLITIICALSVVGCATQPQVPVKKPHRATLRNFNLESGYCPTHQMINLPRQNGYALDPVYNPETYRRTNVENFR